MAYKEHKWKNQDGVEVTIYVDENFDLARIGEWARIGEGASIDARASIGEWASIGEGARIGARARIGEGASIGEWARIGEWASIGEGARIGARASIGEGARIGARASIGEGARIGEGDDCGRPIYIAPLPFGPPEYYITATQKNLAIGCKLHPLDWWMAASDKEIIALDGKKALEYWRRAKPIIFGLLSACDLMPSNAGEASDAN